MSCESIVAFAGCVHYCYIKSRALRVSINFDIEEHVYNMQKYFSMKPKQGCFISPITYTF